MDRGRHEIFYSLHPHLGTWQQARVAHRGYEFNFPLSTFPIEKVPQNTLVGLPLISLGDDDLILTAFKPAYGGNGYVLRFYEPYGRDTTAAISAWKPIRRAAYSNFLEDDLRPVPVRNGTIVFEVKPHEVITLRLQFA